MEIQNLKQTTKRSKKTVDIKNDELTDKAELQENTDKMKKVYAQLCEMCEYDQLLHVMRPILTELFKLLKHFDVYWLMHDKNTPEDVNNAITTLEGDANKLEGAKSFINVFKKDVRAKLAMGTRTVQYDRKPAIGGISLCVSLQMSIYTCIHELGHLIIKYLKLNEAEGLDYNKDKQRYKVINESSCNLFAYYWYLQFREKNEKWIPEYKIEEMRFDNYDSDWYVYDTAIEMNVFELLNEGEVKFIDSMKTVFKFIADGYDGLKETDSDTIAKVSEEHKQKCREWRRLRVEFIDLFCKVVK